MDREINYTPRGYSYVDVSLEECLNWGGLGICDGCNTGPHQKMKLIWALHDTYCQNCFENWLKRQQKYSDEDVSHDIKLQAKLDKQYYYVYSKYFVEGEKNDKD